MHFTFRAPGHLLRDVGSHGNSATFNRPGALNKHSDQMSNDQILGTQQTCIFCGGLAEPEERGTCEECWCDMRFAPQEFEARIKSLGREVVRQAGCRFTGTAIVCGNPYRPVDAHERPSAESIEQAIRAVTEDAG